MIPSHLHLPSLSLLASLASWRDLPSSFSLLTSYFTLLPSSLRRKFLRRTIISQRDLTLELIAQMIETRYVPHGTLTGELLADIAADLRAMKSKRTPSS